MSATVLFVPGLRDRVEDHWQTHAARAFPGSVTVAPLTEDRLSRAARVAALDAALNSIAGDVVIAAHSAGCLMVAHWALASTRSTRAALLATPADVELPLPPGYPTYDELSANGWLPIPRAPLPFPTLVVASRNDPLARFA
ncbi:MAG: RBBP9/YdeN family alpha/beta hydrolase, partial [Novosphingobium sp.]